MAEAKVTVDHVNLRHGLRDNPIQQTAIFGVWNGAVFDNAEYLAAIEYLERKASLVAVGLDEFTPADRFAYRIMAAQARRGGY